LCDNISLPRVQKEPISLESLEKTCLVFHCGVDGILEFINTDGDKINEEF